MIAWSYEIRGADGRLVNREGGFTTKDDAFTASEKYRRNLQVKHAPAGPTEEQFQVTFHDEIIGGSHNAMSRAWEQLIEITDLPVDMLRQRFGVASESANSLTQRLLSANKFALRFERRDKDGEISVSIVDDTLPKSRVPGERIFAVQGDANEPLLSERGGNEHGKTRDVFERLIKWFREFAQSYRR
jgi:hypothetical protein